MKKENIVTRKWGDRRKGKTDWARFDALTDEDIAKAVANDPDAAPIDIDWSDAVLVVPVRKKAISIRVDEDVLDYFKSSGGRLSAPHQRRAAFLHAAEGQAEKARLKAPSPRTGPEPINLQARLVRRRATDTVQSL